MSKAEGYTRAFKCENGRTYMVHPKSCFFCDHCIDIFYDSSGPYGFTCDIAQGSNDNIYDKVFSYGVYGKCEDFKEKKEK